jgi:DNA gyrase/topoisomerase IV subunit A
MPTLIDTRDAFRRLQNQGGFTEDQADAIVDIFTDVDEQVATRGDIDQLRTELQSIRSEMEAMENRLGQDIQKVRSSIVTAVAAVGAVLAVVIPLTIYLVG